MELAENLNSIQTNAEELLRLLNIVQKGGVTQEKIGRMIGLKPTPISRLKKHILPEILQGSINNLIELEELIKSFNCMSRNIYLEFPEFIKILGEYIKDHQLQQQRNQDKSVLRKWKESVNNNIQASKDQLIRGGFLGVYYLFSYSSYRNNHIVKRPMMIMESEYDDSLESYLGNDLMEYKCEGVIQILGSHALHFDAIDYYGNTQDIMNLRFSLPYPNKPKFLRGFFMTIDALKAPYCGRMIAVRESDVISLEEFHSLPNALIDINQPSNAIPGEVLEYLKDEIQANLRCRHFTDPEYGFEELAKEKKWIIDRFKDFKGFD